MGLDLSLCVTGLVVVTDKDEILDKVLIESSSKEENTPRLVGINTKIMKLVKKYNPQLVVIEGPAFGIGKTTSLFQLGELSGILKANLYAINQTFRIVPPTTLKKWATGKGNAPKNIMILQIYKKFGVEFADDNLCDAYALAKYGFQFIDPKLKRRK